MTNSSPNSMRRGDWFGLLTLALGVALVVVDISIVDLILPPIAQDLDLGFAQLQWVPRPHASPGCSRRLS